MKLSKKNECVNEPGECPTVSRQPSVYYQRWGKRLIDCIVASIVLAITSPLSLLVALAIKADSNGPVLFRQTRLGLHGKEISIAKFRSMRAVGAENNQTDNSITRVGHVIRKFGLDEIPQFLNVLKGDMSLVGPRAWVCDFAEYYTEDQKHRMDVLPGITGWAQVNGRNAICITRKIELDLWYVEHMSFLLDLKIVFLTIPAILFDSHESWDKEKEISELRERKLRQVLSREGALGAEVRSEI